MIFTVWFCFRVERGAPPPIWWRVDFHSDAQARQFMREGGRAFALCGYRWWSLHNGEPPLNPPDDLHIWAEDKCLGRWGALRADMPSPAGAGTPSTKRGGLPAATARPGFCFDPDGDVLRREIEEASADAFETMGITDRQMSGQ